MSFTLIRCKDAWASDYRYIESDIAPLEQIPTPKHYPTSSGFYPSGDYYRSGGMGEGDFVYFNLYFASQPTITQRTKGHDMPGSPYYDSNLGVWVWRQNANFGLGSNWTDQSAPITSDFGEHFFNYLIEGGSSETRRKYVTYIMTPYVPTYNWVSVPSVSGKNGILSLSTSTDTNNGEAITTSDTTKFALTAESNINKLIVDRMNQGD